MRHLFVPAAAIALAFFLAACQGQEPAPPPPEPVRVENPRAGVAIAALTGFDVAANDGATIELVPAGDGATGTVTVTAGEPETGGINLVAAVKQHKEDVLARPDGDYKGSAEYVSPLGTTFASRGRYTEDGATVEERIVYMVHPWGDRTLEVVYRYPAGDDADTKARLDALMNGVVGELEGLPAPGAGGGDAAPPGT